MNLSCQITIGTLDTSWGKKYILERNVKKKKITRKNIPSSKIWTVAIVTVVLRDDVLYILKAWSSFSTTFSVGDIDRMCVTERTTQMMRFSAPFSDRNDVRYVPGTTIGLPLLHWEKKKSLEESTKDERTCVFYDVFVLASGTECRWGRGAAINTALHRGGGHVRSALFSAWKRKFERDWFPACGTAPSPLLPISFSADVCYFKGCSC